jgi:hypothetical protein
VAESKQRLSGIEARGQLRPFPGGVARPRSGGILASDKIKRPGRKLRLVEKDADVPPAERFDVFLQVPEIFVVPGTGENAVWRSESGESGRDLLPVGGRSILSDDIAGGAGPRPAGEP